MDEDSMSEKIYEFERYLASDHELPSDELIIDTDELIHEQENGDTPPAMPPESLADFEKAVLGNKRPGVPTIPPVNPD